MLDRHPPESSHLLWLLRRKSGVCLVAFRAALGRSTPNDKEEALPGSNNMMSRERLAEGQSATGLKVGCR